MSREQPKNPRLKRLENGLLTVVDYTPPQKDLSEAEARQLAEQLREKIILPPKPRLIVNEQ